MYSGENDPLNSIILMRFFDTKFAIFFMKPSKTNHTQSCLFEIRISDQFIEQKPYYMAHSNIETLALLDEKHKGTNWHLLRTRSQPIRTISLLPVKIKITTTENIPLCQKLAPKIRELKALGLTHNEIACRLKISLKTVKRALN